jgi:hypothetical protein
VAVGRLLDEARDALAITAPEANLINVIDLSDPDGEPVITPYLGATLGPSVLVAIDIGGDDNTALDDLVISTIYNAPVEHHLELLRNDGAAAMPLEDIELDGEVARANRVVLKAGGPPLAAAIIRTPTADEFRVADVRSGQPVPVLTVEGLSRGSDYVVGRSHRCRDERLHQHHPGHAGQLQHGTHPRWRICDGHPGVGGKSFAQ